MAYLAEGVHACVLRYATGDEVPWSASYADGLAALAWIREHADEHGFDASKIVVVGSSAGGHLAASLGGDDERPDGRPWHQPGRRCGGQPSSFLTAVPPTTW